jgi:Na+(H+)/acetate symporter ActP
MFNAIFKVPMQFAILFVGAMLFVFYQFAPSPMFFNNRERDMILSSEYAAQYRELEQSYHQLDEARAQAWLRFAEARDGESESVKTQALEDARRLDVRADSVRQAGIDLILARDPGANPEDQDRIFLTFVLDHLPVGLIGLLMAVIFSAAMSSTAAELNALASTTVVDIYRRQLKPDGSDRHYLIASKGMTFFWGVVAIGFAIAAGQFENLIEYVNILGSLFYGTILGLFVVAFFFKRIQGRAVFPAALLAEAVVLCCFFLPMLFPATFAWLDIGYLWFNLIGCFCVVFFGWLFQQLIKA